MEAAECGVASLAMILEHHGSSIPLHELREECGTSRDGNSALQLIQAARRLGLKGTGLRLGAEQLESQPLPMILHWRLNHFVVLERFKRGRAVLLNPASGRVQADDEELDRNFSGIALKFTPTAALRRRARPSPGIARYFSCLKTGMASVLFVLVAGAFSQMLGAVSPALQQVLIDEVIAPARESWLVPLLSVQVGVMVAGLVLSWLYQMVLLKLQTSLGTSLSNLMGRRLLRLPLAFVESRSRGDLMQRVISHAGLGDLLTRTASGLFEVAFALALAGLMLAYDLQLAAFALGVDGCRLLLVRYLREDSRQRSAGELAARAHETSVVLQASAAGEVVRAFGLQRRLDGWYRKRLDERLKWTVRANRLSAGAGSWLQGFDGLAQAAVLWVGGIKVIESEMTLGVFAGFLAIRGLLRAPLGSILGTVEGWLEFRSVLERSDEILGQTPDGSGTRSVSSKTPRLELRNVGFRYGSGAPWVFRGVSLVVEAGQTVTLVGPSGHGKSTLLRILAGVLLPSEGEVLLEGVDIREYSRESLAKVLGAVVGTPVILNGSVRDNLRLRVPDASDAQIRRAAQAACFEEVVARMPGGYGSPLSAGGTTLSGGERQRLGLTQALVGSPSLLLLDEATCFLDRETEARVIDNTVQLGTTLISVAHRDAVIEAADAVFRVKSGQVRRETAQRAPALPQLPGCKLSQVAFAGGESLA
jgi:ABC-type bacteriocin/lantibiotic exporter with double-glycine peptidase domain